MKDTYSFRILDLKGVKVLVEMAVEEGWNPGPHDAKAFFEADPQGFYGYFNKEELIGGGSLVSYDGKFGFMGFFIMKQSYRGQGIGRELWIKRRDTLLSRLQKGASIGMDGVVAMQPFYKQGGFELAYKDERYEKIGRSYPISPQISAITISDFESILEYDKSCFGFKREIFLKSWLNIPGLHTFKYVESDSLKGYACMRAVNKGFKICPLFADNQDIAVALYQTCLSIGKGEPIYLDVPTPNKAAIEMVKRHEAEYVFECGRMYYGSPPKLKLDKVYGVTSFELG